MLLLYTGVIYLKVNFSFFFHSRQIVLEVKRSLLGQGMYFQCGSFVSQFEFQKWTQSWKIPQLYVIWFWYMDLIQDYIFHYNYTLLRSNFDPQKFRSGFITVDVSNVYHIFVKWHSWKLLYAHESFCNINSANYPVWTNTSDIYSSVTTVLTLLLNY